MTIPHPLAPSPTDLARDGTADLAFARNVGALSPAEMAFYRAAFPAWVRRALASEAETAKLRAALDGERRMAQGDGTDRLLAVLYGSPTPGHPTIGKAFGGSQAPMLWDAAEEIERLREENEGLRRMVDSLAAERQVLHGVTEED